MTNEREPGCPSCGVAWREHLGMIGTCAALRDNKAYIEDLQSAYDKTLARIAELERENARLVSATCLLIGYASTVPIAKPGRWHKGFVSRLNDAADAVGATLRYSFDGRQIKRNDQ